MRKKIILGSIITLSLALIAVKFYWATHEYRYVVYGFDTARIMQAITETLANESLLEFIAPHVGIYYLAGVLQLITGISSADTLFIPLFLFCFLGFSLLWVMTRQITGNITMSVLAGLFFAAALTIPIASYSIHFAFIALPLFIIFFIYYIDDKISIWPLILAAENMVTSYPSIPYLIFLALGIFCFFNLIAAISKNDALKIAKYCDFFLILPALHILNYFFSNSLVVETYRPYDVFLNRSLGLSRFGGSDLLVTIPVHLAFFSFILVYTLQFYYEKLVFLAQKTHELMRNFSGKFGNLARKFMRQIVLLMTIILTWEIFVNLIFFDGSGVYSISYYIFKFFYRPELWVDYYGYAYVFYFVMMPVGMLYLLTAAEQPKNAITLQKIILLMIIPGLFLLSFIPDVVNPLKIFYGHRGYRTIFLFIFSGFAIIYYLFLIKNIHRKTLIIWGSSFLLLASIIFSFWGDYKFYQLKPNPAFIEDMKWLEKNTIDHSIFFLVTDYFQSDPAAFTKPYTYSFVHSTVSYKDLIRVNHEGIVLNNFNEFIRLLDKNKVSYIVTEANYDQDSLKRIRQIAKFLYSSPNGIRLFRYVPSNI